MRIYDFEIILESETMNEGSASEYIDRYAEPLFEHFQGDVVPAVRDGKPLVDCSLEADSLENAIQEVIRVLLNLGLTIHRVEIEPMLFTAAA